MTREPVAADLAVMIRIASVGGSPQEHEVQHWVAERMRALGMSVRTWRTPVARLQRHPGFPGMEVEREAVTGVLATLAGTRPEAVLLLGHTDVVPAAGWEQAFRPEVAGGDVVGRGAVDMKGGVAALLQCVRSIRSAGIVPERTLHVAVVSAEEDGGAGTFDLVEHLPTPPEACVVAEPTNGDVVVANAGALGFRITVHGRSAHAARRWEGIDAVDLVVAVQQALRRLEAEDAVNSDPLLRQWPIPHPTSIGIVEGGDWSSTVMPSASLVGRYGIALGTSLAEARSRFEGAVARAVDAVDRDASAEIAWEGGQFAPARQDPEAAFVQRLVAAHEAVTGERPELTGTTYGSDLRLLLAAGIPAALYGPGDTRLAHAEGERVAIEDVRAVAEVLTRWVVGPT